MQVSPQGVAHYENFPVASWLCPPHLRAPIVAIYRVARAADDLADEGHASPSERLAQLAAFRSALDTAFDLARDPVDAASPVSHHAAMGPWLGIMLPLVAQARLHQLPVAPFHQLLSAFEQDVRYTAQGHTYPDMPALLDYCQRSANPVGRLLLHLYQVDDPTSLAQSDAVCTALQLINFWQDLSLDLVRGRYYLPQDALDRYGLPLPDWVAAAQGVTPMPARFHPFAAQALVHDLCAHARELMHQGAPLALRLPGRMGWELRLVVQGGLRIVDHIEALQGRTWVQRPRLGALSIIPLAWRAWRMPHLLARVHVH